MKSQAAVIIDYLKKRQNNNLLLCDLKQIRTETGTSQGAVNGLFDRLCKKGYVVYLGIRLYKIIDDLNTYENISYKQGRRKPTNLPTIKQSKETERESSMPIQDTQVPSMSIDIPTLVGILTTHNNATFHIKDRVRKKSGSWWEGTVVGTYSTEQTPEGYCVQLDHVPNGAVQIYPANALELLVD